METIKHLAEERARAWEEAKALLEAAEAEDRDLTGEEQAKYEALTARIDELGRRKQRLEEIKEREERVAEARDEAVVAPEARANDRVIEEELRALFRGERDAVKVSLADAEVRVAHDGRVEVRDLVKGTSAAGGATVPTGFIPRLVEHLVEASAIRRTGATIITTTSGETLLLPRTTAYGSAAIVAEGAAAGESDPAFAQVSIGAYKFGKLIQVSRELIEDTAVDILGFVAREAGLAIGQAAGQKMVVGTGTNEPEGAQSSSALTVGKQGANGQTTTVTADDLIDLYHSVVSGYRSRGVWFMLDASLAKVRKLKDAQNQYLWQPGLQAGVPDMLLGRPVVTDPFMPAMGASVKSILFGDFGSYYVIRDVRDLEFRRSDDFAFANDLVTFRAILRTDGRVVDPNAVKAYQNSAT